MKTTTYSDILYRAGELAGRTRDKLPPSEAIILQAALAVDLEDVWNKAVWPELTPDPEEMTVADQKFSKREGDPDEIGDVLVVLSADPKATTRYRGIGFVEGDGEIWIDENLASVWVEYMLPAPDLMSVAAEDLADYGIPQRFRNYLSFRGAGALLNADSAGTGISYLQLGEAALTTQLNRLPAPPEWRQVRLRSGFGRRKMLLNTTQ